MIRIEKPSDLAGAGDREAGESAADFKTKSEKIRSKEEKNHFRSLGFWGLLLTGGSLVFAAASFF